MDQMAGRAVPDPGSCQVMVLLAKVAAMATAAAFAAPAVLAGAAAIATATAPTSYQWL